MKKEDLDNIGTWFIQLSKNSHPIAGLLSSRITFSYYLAVLRTRLG